MEIKKEKRLVEQETTVYIAMDGEEFCTKRDCERHESMLRRKSLIEKAEKLRIKDLDGKFPIDDNALPYEGNHFIWYKVGSVDDYEAVDNAYGNHVDYPDVMPEIVCVESCGIEEYDGDVYTYHLSNMKASTEDFWSRLGYKVTLEKVEEIC